MPDSSPAVYLDEDVSIVVAAILRARGFEVVTARDIGQLGLSDSEQLASAAQTGRVFLTHNRVDFERLHREWLESGRSH
jgi:predicted nuclease of predicted toxin-antitoxin system